MASQPFDVERRGLDARARSAYEGERHWRIWGSCLKRAAVVARTARVGVENAGRAEDVQSAPLFYTSLLEGPGTLACSRPCNG